MLTKLFSVQEKNKPLCGVALMLSYPQEKVASKNLPYLWRTKQFIGKKSVFWVKKPDSILKNGSTTKKPTTANLEKFALHLLRSMSKPPKIIWEMI